MLYILKFSVYFFGFITVPYQTRVLGPTLYGKIGTAMVLMVYFQLLIDYGFILSGTKEVAICANDPKAISRVYSSVQYLKIGLVAISFVALTLLCFLIPGYRDDLWFYVLYLFGTAVNGMVPDFVYRGIQEMGAITLRVVISRIFFTLTLFVFLKGPQDYMVIPLLAAIGNFVAFAWSVLYLKKYKVHLTRVSMADLMSHMKASSTFFLSRIAGAIQTNFSVILLRNIDPVACGYYTAADKLYTTGQSALSPITDSIYPYMTIHRDFKLIKKILKMLMPLIAVTCVIGFVFSNEICVIMFGEDFVHSGKVLKALMPGALFTLPDYLFGFGIMSALGITKHANYSIYLSTGFFIIGIGVLAFFGAVTAVHLALLTSSAMIIDMLYRVYQVRRRWLQILREEQAAKTV